MGFFMQWFSSTSPIMKGVVFLGATTAMVVVYKGYIRPYQKRQDMMASENYASLIFEDEQIKKNDLE